MIDGNLNNDILENDDLLNEKKNDEEVNNSERALIEDLNDTTTVFTPVVSDGIFEEEILEFNEDNVVTVDENFNDLIEEESIENLEIISNEEEKLDNNNNIVETQNDVSENNESVINDTTLYNNEVNDTEEEPDFTNLEADDTKRIDTNNNDNNVVTQNDTTENNESVINDTNLNNNEVNDTEEEPDFTNLEANDIGKVDTNNSDNNVVETQNDVIENDESTSSDTNLNNNETSEVKEQTLLERYGENFSVKEYVCNPAIGRDNEIKQLILTLLTPEKSGILVGKPGIGKTAIVEGLGYQIQKGNVPDALKEYQIHKLNTSSLLGLMPGTNEPKIQVLLNEIKGKQKLILFIDEIHTLIGAGADGDDSLDFANIFKPGLDRGNIKIIGATTSDEYDKYILTDKAFVRRFQKIDVQEPTKEHTVKIMMGSLPKLEHKTGAKLKYTPFIQEKIMTFIVDLTTEYRRVYELSARYPDVALTILQQAFSYAVFDNKKEVSIRDVRKAICNTKLVYPDVIKKELVRFNEIFSDIYLMETPQRLKGEISI